MSLPLMGALLFYLALGGAGHTHLGALPGFEGYSGWWTQEMAEVPEETPCEVQGEIPNWLAGSLVRNGPGIFEYGGSQLHHQFDGLSKLNKFTLRGGKALFQTRFLRTDLYNTTMRTGKMPPHMTMLASTPAYTYLEKVQALKMEGTTNQNIFVWKTGDVHYATSDQPEQMRFNLDTLDCEGKVAYAGDDASAMSGAHKQPAFAKEGGGETVGWQGSPGLTGGMTIRVYRDSAGLKRRFIGSAQVPWIPIIHSFAVTENYIILVVPNVAVSFGAMIQDLLSPSRPFGGIEGLTWNGGEHHALVLVFDAHSTDPMKSPVRTFETQAVYFNHHVNAFEESEGGSIVMDLVGYDNGDFLRDPRGFGNVDVMKNDTARQALQAMDPQLRRYRLNMTAPLAPGARAWSDFELFNLISVVGEGKVRIEMPRFNERAHRGRPYCYVYGMSLDGGGHPNLAKADLCKGGRARTWQMPDHYPSEPIFVPRPGASAEDDGIVLSVVLDGPRRVSYLLVLEAATMTALASVYTNLAVPYDVHGQFFPDSTMYSLDEGSSPVVV